MKTFKERFADVFSELGDIDQLVIFNKWADTIGEEPIYEMGEFDDLMCGLKPLDIAMRVHFGDFNPNYAYFRFDGYGSLESTEFVHWWIEDYMDDLADWYEDHKDVLTSVCSDMEEICEEENEEENEEE